MKEFTNQNKLEWYRKEFLYITCLKKWREEQQVESDMKKLQEYIKNEDSINYHVTMMMRVIGVGGSHFLLENLCF